MQPRRPPGGGRASLAITALVAATLAGAGATPCRGASLPVGREHRLLLGFMEDGGIVGRAWFEASMWSADFGDGRDDRGTMLAAFRYGRDVEAGVRAGILHRRRDTGAALDAATVDEGFSTTGAADAVLYGKYRVLRGTIDLALGASASLPLADDRSGLTSGAAEVRGFVGGRGPLPGGAAVVGHAGFATAGGSGIGGASGRTAVRAGVGALVPLARLWTLIVEIEHEGAIYEGQRSATLGLAGLDWRPTESIVVRGGLGGGGGRAPDATGILAVAFHF